MSAPLHLLPDAPITSPGFDRLDRMAFVRSFSQAIRAAQGTDSVVLALAGPWGSGKSSLLNLIAGELQGSGREDEPLIVRFNPWWFTGTEQLVAAFLQQLGAAVSRPEVKDSLGAATAELDRLAEALATPGKLDHEGDLASRDIETIRHSIDDIFRRSPRRILVFMDDIDRLTPREMHQLLLIVRAVADFPNTTYVLSFDYEVVVRAIGDKLAVDGRTYLEKVIQLQIDVPLPGRKILGRMFLGQLGEIDPETLRLDPDSQRQFRMLFESGVKHFLATPRACTRLLNVLRFTYPTLAGQVHFPDLLGISCLMSFSSQSIQAIRSFSDAFVGHCDEKGRGWSDLKSFHTSWLGRIPRQDFAAVESIVRLLFPKVAWALNGPSRGSEHLEAWNAQKRVCAPKHFDAYFRLGLTAGEAAEHVWQNMVELLDDATAFAQALNQFGPLEEERGQGWVSELLQQAGDFVSEQASSAQAGQLFRAIMRRGDRLAAAQADDSHEGTLIEPIHWVVKVLLDCLLRISRPADRLNALRESVSDDAGLLTSSELVELLDYRVDIFADEDDEPTDEANTAKLMEVLKILDARIQAASRDGELEAHPQFMKVVQKWYGFGRRARARKWVGEACESDERFVQALIQLRTSPDLDLGGPQSDTQLSLPLELLLGLFEREHLRDRSEQILQESPPWLSDEGSRTLEHLSGMLE